MSYINHYEIEARCADGSWEHIGNYYPKYNWCITRPWWLLGLVCRPVIGNDAASAAKVARSYVASTLARLQCQHRCDAFRIWEWHQGMFRRLTKRLAWKMP